MKRNDVRQGGMQDRFDSIRDTMNTHRNNTLHNAIALKKGFTYIYMRVILKFFSSFTIFESRSIQRDF